MGGFGSGRQGGGRCTDDMHALDVRKIQRRGLLRPGLSLTWQWTCNEKTIATIRLQVEADRVVLDYRNQSVHTNGGAWEPMNYAVWLDWTPCALGGKRVWWRRPAAAGALRCCMAGVSSPVASASAWPTEVSVKRPTTEPLDGLTRSGGGWAGTPASSTATA